MTTSVRKRRPPVRIRHAGYIVGVVANSVLLVLVNAWPGWDVLPFLTPPALSSSGRTPSGSSPSTAS